MKKPHKVALSLGSVWYAAVGPLSSERQRGLKAETSKVASVHLHLLLKPEKRQMMPCSAQGAISAFQWRLPNHYADYPEHLKPQNVLFWKSNFYVMTGMCPSSESFFYLYVKHATGTSAWGFDGKFFFPFSCVLAYVMHTDSGKTWMEGKVNDAETGSGIRRE